MTDFPASSSDIIVADPPWKFASNSEAKPGRNAMRHYACMTDAEIAALPMLDLLAKDSLLFMWTTSPMLERSMTIARESWGLTYISQAIWWKLTAGTGYWFRGGHEIVLLYKRGRFPRPEQKAPFPDSVIVDRAREHSRKPEKLQEWIDAAYPDASKLEMFARRPRDGWAVWGNQTEKFEGAV